MSRSLSSVQIIRDGQVDVDAAHQAAYKATERVVDALTKQWGKLDIVSRMRVFTR
jgi:hypothetical protein